MKISKKWVLIWIMFIMGVTGSVYAGEDIMINQVRDIDSSFLMYKDNVIEKTHPLVSSLGNVQLIDFYENNQAIGYVVTIDGQIVEFAEKPSPYLLYSPSYDGRKLYYDYASYGEIINEGIICFDANGKKIEEVVSGDGISTRAVLPGVSPQLQNSHNCVAAALSNLIWYWGNHGKSSLITGKTFETVKNNVTTQFNNYGAGFANNAVVAVANLYGKSVSPNVTFSGAAYWSNSSATMTADLDSGYPCLVGFKADPNSPYSNSVGHMTMCFGYYYNYSVLYIVLADGWSNSSVTRRWDSYNDCTIRVRPN